MTLLIRGGRILAGAPAALTRADVLIEGDRIAAVGPRLTAPAGATEIDASRHIVLPGLGNAHTHAASHLSRGRAGNWTLETLLTYAPANYGFRTPEDEYLSAAIGAIIGAALARPYYAIPIMATGMTTMRRLPIAITHRCTNGYYAPRRYYRHYSRPYTHVGGRVAVLDLLRDCPLWPCAPAEQVGSSTMAVPLVCVCLECAGPPPHFQNDPR